MISAVRAGALVVVLVPALSACTRADREPAPNAAPAVTWSTSASVAAPASAAVSSAAPGAGFTSFATPCPKVGDRDGKSLSAPQDTSVDTTVDCSFGDQSKFPQVTSVSTIHKPGNPKGSPEHVTVEQYRALVAHAQTSAVDGVTTRKVSGLGDDATLVVSFKDNLALLVVRSDNALIQAMARINARGDREREVIELQAQEPEVTALARALLAELR
ncbi:MAG TPA: hypothetical protein VGB74_19400 [Actinoplanes sp.]|jgi:hypothetical protein